MASKLASYLEPEGFPKHLHQEMQETPWEAKIRAKGNFAEIEAQMPMLRSRRRASIVDRFTAILGLHNPHYHPVDPKEHKVWLFNNTAYKDGHNKWAVEVVAAYFVKDSGDDSSEAVAKISETIGLTQENEKERVAERLKPFLDCVLPAHVVNLDLEEQTFKLGPSSTEGISSQIIKFKSKQPTGTRLRPILEGLPPSLTPPETVLAEPEGWAVISDIDDTIKVTMTGSALGVLRSTFVDDPLPIAGMPDFYRHMSQTLNNPPFWYLSASPYNLYGFLAAFRAQANYPPGTLILRDASWMSLAGLLSSVTQGTQAYKVDRMQKIRRWFPDRRFVCIGDSSQSDPEAYGQIYREHKDWIAAIWIRRVTGVSEVDMDEDEKNGPQRFERAFEDVPREVWSVFDDPKELYEKLDKLKTAKQHWWS